MKTELDVWFNEQHFSELYCNCLDPPLVITLATFSNLMSQLHLFEGKMSR